MQNLSKTTLALGILSALALGDVSARASTGEPAPMMLQSSMGMMGRMDGPMRMQMMQHMHGTGGGNAH